MTHCWPAGFTSESCVRPPGHSNLLSVSRRPGHGNLLSNQLSHSKSSLSCRDLGRRAVPTASVT